MDAILPPRLEKGSTIGVFSPSVAITAEAEGAALRAERFIQDNGYKVKRGSLWGKKREYKSGTAAERAAEFNSLLYDEDVCCIMAAIGGFVSNGMLPYLDYDYFASHPKVIVGLSDVTALLMGI